MQRFNVLTGELDHESARPGFRWRGTRVGERIGGARIGASVYELAEGELTFPYHLHHGVEEWLWVLAGTPAVRTPDGTTTLAPGDIICFPSGPAGAHTVRGPGRVMMFSANRPHSMTAYPDSDKLGTRPVEAADRLNFRRADAVDYWEGE
jgi:uncharacterized cupin superfamily protein